MKSFTVLNNFRQYKVSYGDYVYWKLGNKWYADYHDNHLALLTRTTDANLIDALETNLNRKLDNV